MKTVAVKFVDFWPGFVPENSTAWASMLRCGFQPVLSDRPDYLFYSLFGESNLMYEKCIRIFYTGENYTPDFNLCDFAVGFDYLSFGGRYLRLPLFALRQYERAFQMCMEKHKNPEQTLREKSDFCSFVYSNRRTHPIRLEIFETLTDYKRVNSGGRLYNTLKDMTPVKDKILFESKHKFSIACENSTHPGYCTEKIVESFAAKTVPIYWGDPLVNEMFNPKAFINVSDFRTVDDMVDYIEYLDNNDAEYLKILSEPAIVNEDYFPAAMQRRADDFLRSVLSMEKRDAVLRNQRMNGQKELYKKAVSVKNQEFVNQYFSFVSSEIGQEAYRRYCGQANSEAR